MPQPRAALTILVRWSMKMMVSSHTTPRSRSCGAGPRRGRGEDKDEEEERLGTYERVSNLEARRLLLSSYAPACYAPHPSEHMSTAGVLPHPQPHLHVVHLVEHHPRHLAQQLAAPAGG